MTDADQERVEGKDALDIAVALGRLTPDRREAFYDHTVLGRTHQEIADTMGLSKSRVSQLVRAGRADFRRAMGARCEVAA